ncbi:phospholipase D family protein [uncultured Aliiroseovarius sp.]|uniref:phospholipase D family protein n=1 Tax=uncultured Aliiroseovarius sp. TaxID=1658783 RepID=UPI00259A6051|nr:phospholipase D family protein [uncultured Aliiroseovarius sp.]
MFVLKLIAIAVSCIFFFVIVARVIFPLPETPERIDSAALPVSDSAPIVRAIRNRLNAHAGQTGIGALDDGANAFAARMILAEAAVSSIDAQYYIWQNDLTGTLLLEALQRAAQRGVRVRLLLDDNGTSGLDAELASLDAHPNVEVRLYNPFNLRRFKMLSYGFDFFRLNRRMHNKSFTVDGAATILGGRNIGDQYFGTGPTALYLDLDVLAVGKVVPEVAADFDKYWAAPAVHPAGPILGLASGGDPISDRLERFQSTPQMAEYRKIIEASDIVAALSAGSFDLEWTKALLVSDDPVKGLGAVPKEDLLAVRLRKAVGRIESRFDGISPYFVPGAAGVKAFSKLESEGVQVRMLTNALEATDVLPVHAGYAKRRRDLLAVGVEIFELQKQLTIRIPPERVGPIGSSGTSLHAKTFAVDGKRVFVGSFNFDPRSTRLNTEMGLLIESSSMARIIHASFDRKLDGVAWQVELRDDALTWRNNSETTISEPGTTWIKSVLLKVIGWLPVEWLL